LKPENILLDVDGHIKLTDFGLAKMNMGAAHRTNSFCGSPEYISPEMLRHQGHGRSVDYYTLGALLFEMLTGLPPFYHSDRKTMYRLILRQDVKVPDFLTKQAKSLLR
jgi:serum/glucocorticoid-regulated kinase 2